MKLPALYELRAFWEDGAVSQGTTSPDSARYKLSRWLETFAARRADALVTICQGMRQELIERARSALQENPDRYNDTLYGEHEVGGTGVLYISNVDLSWLGLREQLGREALPRATDQVLATVPPVFVGVGATLAGLRWIIGRREKIARENAEAARPPAEDASDADESGGEES